MVKDSDDKIRIAFAIQQTVHVETVALLSLKNQHS
jgi:hypothetical protein